MTSKDEPAWAHAYSVDGLALMDTVCTDIATIHRIDLTDTVNGEGEGERKKEGEREREREWEWEQPLLILGRGAVN